MAKKKLKFDWKITTKKFAVDAAIVILSGLISVYAENPAYLAFIPAAKAILNILKNYKK